MNNVKDFCERVIEGKLYELKEVDCNGIACSDCPFSFRNNMLNYCDSLSPKQVIELAEKYIEETKFNIQIGDIIKVKHSQVLYNYFIVKRIGKYIDNNTKYYECNLLNNGSYNIFMIYGNDIIEVFSKE